MTNHAVYPKLIILSYWNTHSGSFFDWEISPLSGSIAPCVNFVYHGKED